MKFSFRKEVTRLKGYTLEAQPHLIKLNQNESPYDLPGELKAAVLERLASLPWNRYPTPFCEAFREMLAEKIGWPKDGLLVTGGSNILIQAILMSLSIGGRVMTVSPSFSLYEIESALLGNRLIRISLEPKDFSLPVQRLIAGLRKTKPRVLFLANPNAPTGNLFTEDDLLMVIGEAQKRGTIAVVDEAYYPFSKKTLLPRLRDFVNLILIRTFSKAYSLAGVRLGYMVADPRIITQVQKAVLPFSVGSLTAAVGEFLLENDSFVQPVVDEIIAEREIIYRRLEEIPGLRVTPSRANFILFQSKQFKKIFERLLEEGVLIRDVSSKDLPNALRVTVGSPDENRLFIDTLSRIFPRKSS